MPKKAEPYIAVELEAIEQAPAVAALAGRSEAEVGWGLVKLWRHAWRLRVAEVPEQVVDAYLPGCRQALTVFDFIAPGEAGTVILRGMRRYLRVKEAQARAARATNRERYGERSLTDPEHDHPGPETVGERVGERDGERGGERVGERPLSDPQERRAKSEERKAKSEKRKAKSEKTTARRSSTWEQLLARMVVVRAERLEALGQESQPQELSPARVNQLLSGAARSLYGVLDDVVDAAPEERAEDLYALWQRYLWSSYWRGRTPPYPLEGFCAPKTLRRCVDMWGSELDPVSTREEWA